MKATNKDLYVLGEAKAMYACANLAGYQCTEWYESPQERAFFGKCLHVSNPDVLFRHGLQKYATNNGDWLTPLSQAEERGHMVTRYGHSIILLCHPKWEARVGGFHMLETLSLDDILRAMRRVCSVLLELWVYNRINYQHADRGVDCTCGQGRGLIGWDLPIGCRCNRVFFFFWSDFVWYFDILMSMSDVY